MSRCKKWLLAGGIFLLALAVLTEAFFWYVSDYYRAKDVALEVLAQDSTIKVQDDLTILSPGYPPRWRQRPTCPYWVRSSRPTSPAFWCLSLPHGDF